MNIDLELRDALARVVPESPDAIAHQHELLAYLTLSTAEQAVHDTQEAAVLSGIGLPCSASDCRDERLAIARSMTKNCPSLAALAWAGEARNSARSTDELLGLVMAFDAGDMSVAQQDCARFNHAGKVGGLSLDDWRCGLQRTIEARYRS